MKNFTTAKVILWLLVVPFALTSCNDKMKEHYEVPDWLKGSTYEVLAERGDYTIFLEAAEISGFKPLLEGKSILTVMAPNDAAFATYLNAKGYSDVSEMDKEELTKLIGFHLLYYSYNKEKLRNFRPEGDQISDVQRMIGAGLYYKFRTRSSSTPSVEIDRKTGKHVTVYHLERFLPVFSDYLFATKGIDAKTNYEYFYPNSSWSGLGGFNVSNASVTEYGIIANNGYVYAIDKVLEPLETIYTELAKRDDYSTFFNLYNGYSNYVYDATLSADYGKSIGVDSLYFHTHEGLPSIAMEWPVPSYQSVKELASISYSVFAPSNSAINSFFDRFWALGHYESLEDVDPLIMKYLLAQYVYAGSLTFPEQITKGMVKNSFGTIYNFDPYAATNRTICVNGSLYGLSDIGTPPLFGSVAGPAFRDKSRAPYLYALSGSGLLNSYVSSAVTFTTLVPTGEQMKNNGIELKSYTTGNVLQSLTPEGWSNLSSSAMQELVNIHIVSGATSIKPTGTQVYQTQLAFNYLYVKDGKITSSALYNKILQPDNITDPFVPFTEITNNGAPWSNGKVYEYPGEQLFVKEASDGFKYSLAVCNDKRFIYNTFVQLLKKAGMVVGNTILGLPISTGSRVVAFIPSDAAIKTALASNKIPGIKSGTVASDGSITVTAANLDALQLKNYLYSYFLSSEQNVIQSYPYLGSPMTSKAYQTVNFKQLNYVDTGSSMSVQLESGNVVNVSPAYNYFPFAFEDGCFHIIDSVL